MLRPAIVATMAGKIELAIQSQVHLPIDPYQCVSIENLSSVEISLSN
jgi:hypothetical protein